MLNQSRQTRARLLKISDGALFALALLSAYFIRARLEIMNLPRIETFAEHIWLFPVIAVVGPSALAFLGFYQHPQIVSRLTVIWTIMRGTIITMLALISVLFLVRMQFARSVIILGCSFGGLLVLLRDELYVRMVAMPISRSQWRQRVLWVGISEENTRLRDALSFEERAQIESITEFDPRNDPIDQLAPILHDYAINVVS